MDKKDKQILDILEEDGSLTTRQISKKTLIPITTVHKRIKKLKENKTIKKFTIELDHDKIGKRFLAYILINLNINELREKKMNQHDLLKKIKKLEEVENSDIVVGLADILIKVRVVDVKEYDNFLLNKLHKIEGINNTNTLTVISEGE